MSIQDFLGNPILVGSEIVYASMVGRSPRLTKGIVTKIGTPKSPHSYYKISITVQPKQDSWGSRDTGEWDPISHVYHLNVKDPKPVTLHFTDRLMVIA